MEVTSWQQKWERWRKLGRLETWQRCLKIYMLVFLVWGLYRYLWEASVWVEEVVLKGLVFGGAVMIALGKERKRWVDLGIRGDQLFRSVKWGMLMGLVLGIVGQLGYWIKRDGFGLQPNELQASEMGSMIIILLITAFWEGLFFYGLLVNKLKRTMSEDKLVWIVAIGYMLLHVPNLVLNQEGGWGQVGVMLASLMLLGMGNSILMLRLNNLAAPIMTQVLWGLVVFWF